MTIDVVQARSALPWSFRRRLAAPAQVHRLVVGPLDGAGRDRGGLLAAIRDELDAGGFHQISIHAGRRHRVVAAGEQARSRLLADEARAERDDSWWTDDVVWRHDDGASYAVAPESFHPSHLTFLLWGPAAGTTCQRLASLGNTSR